MHRACGPEQFPWCATNYRYPGTLCCHPTDERVPRLRQLPDGRIVHVTSLYTARELRTSRTYNELTLRATRGTGPIRRTRRTARRRRRPAGCGTPAGTAGPRHPFGAGRATRILVERRSIAAGRRPATGVKPVRRDAALRLPTIRWPAPGRLARDRSRAGHGPRGHARDGRQLHRPRPDGARRTGTRTCRPSPICSPATRLPASACIRKTTSRSPGSRRLRSAAGASRRHGRPPRGRPAHVYQR